MAAGRQVAAASCKVALEAAQQLDEEAAGTVGSLWPARRARHAAARAAAAGCLAAALTRVEALEIECAALEADLRSAWAAGQAVAL